MSEGGGWTSGFPCPHCGYSDRANIQEFLENPIGFRLSCHRCEHVYEVRRRDEGWEDQGEAA